VVHWSPKDPINFAEIISCISDNWKYKRSIKYEFFIDGNTWKPLLSITTILKERGTSFCLQFQAYEEQNMRRDPDAIPQ